MTCEWCEMSPCECVDEDGNDYNAAERLLDKVAVTAPALALAIAESLEGEPRQ